jgi:putative nucleotidyltransferase with HDIG domain
MAWGAPAPAPSLEPGNVARPEPRLEDPFGGASDVTARILRAVGDPDTRFHEDALRMLRAVRLATTLGFTIEPATFAAIRRQAHLARFLSGERVATELERLLAVDRPSVGLRLLQESGLLEVIAPEFTAQVGMPQNKIPGEDLWEHTLRAVDAPGPSRPVVRLAALLHDIGKPATASPEGYPDHEKVGADMAEAFLTRYRFPRATIQRVVQLVRNHMFSYEPAWSDAAVRRFIRRIGPQALEELFELREADNVGSGLPRDAGLTVLRERVAAQLEAHVALSLRDLAINGDDLMSELGLPAGPHLGRILESLLDQVLADSTLNDRPTLLLLAQSMASADA